MSGNAVFTTEIGVRWSDQDLNGHVNNAHAITLMEEACVRATLAWTGTSPTPKTPHVVRTINADYDRELSYAPVTARVWVSRLGRTSYTVTHELYQDGERCVHGDAVIVNLDPETRRPAPLTDDERALLVGEDAG